MATELKKLTVDASNGSYTFEVVDAEARETANAAKTAAEGISIPTALPNPNKLTFTGGATGTYDGTKPVTINIPTGGEGSGGSGPVQYVESLDEANLANLRDLTTGTYVLYGYFLPYAGAADTLTCDNTLVSVAHLSAGSHVLVFNPLNCKVNFVEILVDESAEGGHTYSVDLIDMRDLNALIAMVGELEGLITTEKTSIVAAINEVAANGGGSGGTGLSDTEKKLMLTLFKNAGYEDESMLDTYNELATLWGGETIEPEEPDEPDTPEVTLSSISATYSGGDVAVGTAVTALTGIVVTAHYSDGTSEAVTGYTLSGTIAEGSNTVTVSYGGKTTTFSVTGVAESGGDGNFISIPATQNTGYVERNIFADDGTTLVRDGTFPSWCYISEETFEQDTRVKFIVTPGWSGTRNSSIFAGSAVSVTDLDVYFVEGVKGETTEDASYEGESAVERIVTVKAGHKAILLYSNGIVMNAAMEADIVRCTGITLSADTLEFTGEGSKTLTATVTPNNCSELLHWESSNTNIVTVENGVVTAVNNGTATITAKCGAYSASCTVSASGFVVDPLYPFTNGTCTVTDNAGTIVGEITITNGNHINMTRTYGYTSTIPGYDLPETAKANNLGVNTANKRFYLNAGEEVRTVVTFSDSNKHTAGLSVRLYAANAVNNYTEILANITESGEATYTMPEGMDVSGIGVYLESGTGVLDCDIEIYVNGARYV